jgi:hypothetical protein
MPRPFSPERSGAQNFGGVRFETVDSWKRSFSIPTSVGAKKPGKVRGADVASGPTVIKQGFPR